MTGTIDQFAIDYVEGTLLELDKPACVAGHEELRGFDMDGVICTLGPPYDKCKPLLIPGGRFVIISARPEKAREVTERWLAEHGIRPEGLYLRDSSASCAGHKVRWCKQLGVEYFYESDLDITRALVKAGIQAFHVRRMK